MRTRYRLQPCITLSEYEGPDTVEVGRFVDLENDEEVVAVVLYREDLEKQYTYRMAATTRTVGGREIGAIYINRQYRDLFRNEPGIFRALAFHELGHIMLGHVDRSEREETTRLLMRKRTFAIKNGAVDRRELEADAFAADNVSKRLMERMFDYLVEQRSKRADPDAGLAIREFELRREALEMRWRLKSAQRRAERRKRMSRGNSAED